MTVVVSKDLDAKEVEDLLGKIQKAPKVLDAGKYFGKVKVEGDPLQVQRSMRDEEA